MEEYGAYVKLITIDVEWRVLYYDRLLETGVIKCEPHPRFVVQSERKLDDEKATLHTTTKSIVCETSLEDDPTQHMREESSYIPDMMVSLLASGRVSLRVSTVY